jgi:hypothetical protein
MDARPAGALIDFYRCPETLINLSLTGELSGESAFFYFGQEVLCYGERVLDSLDTVASSCLPDLFPQVIYGGPGLRLPFNPSQIVDNLRRERYTINQSTNSRAILSGEEIRKIYYFVRPLLGVSLRKHLQRLFLRNWDKISFPKWPVDATVERILERVLCLCMKTQEIDTIPFIWFWPEGAPSCVMVTHDIETKAGVEFTSRLMDIDSAFEIKASFQVIPEKQYSVSEGFLDRIRDRGFELNVQDLTHEGNLFDNRAAFLIRAQSINQYLKEYGAQGFRSGRLYRNTDWYEALDISYDMSVPNVAHLESQRGGCCTVFPYFIGNILELPLTTSQDYSVFHILGEYSIQLWKKQIALIMEKNGLVSFIVHPDYIRREKALAVYKVLLRYLSDLRNEGNLWIALPREVSQWWRERSKMKLVMEDGKWRIRGPGHERARLAYARLRGDEIVYSLGAD